MGTLSYNPLIVALDVESAPQALDLIHQLGDSIDFYKIGLELYTAEGNAVVKAVLDQGKQVFLDLKFHDIPETVKRAVSRAAQLGVHLLTVHAYPQVMAAAAAGRGDSPLRLLGVTVLTSLAESDLVDIGYPEGTSIGNLVGRRVKQGLAAGIDGFVCSPLEAQAVRSLAGPNKVLVTPGVRSPGKDSGDQKRVATPAEAIKNGASYLVIGRQITRAADPRSAAQQILLEIDNP